MQLINDNRTMWFFFLAFVAVVGAQSGAYVSVALTNWSPWGALIVFLILGLFNASLPLLIPETLKLDPTEEELLAERITIQEARDAFVRRSAFREHITEAWHSLATIVDNRSIALIILTTMVLAATHQQLVTLFLSNIRRRFNDHHGAVSTPFAIYNFAYLPIFAVFFPLLTYFLTPPRSGLSYFRRDLLLARISAAFIPVGFLLLGMPNMAVVIAGLAAFTLSIGLGPLLQSLVTHYVESGKTARLFALIGALVTIQWFVADPFFLWLSGESIRLSPFWHGLPFLVLAALGALVAVALWFVRSEVFIVVIPRDGGDDDARLLDEESIAQIE